MNGSSPLLRCAAGVVAVGARRHTQRRYQPLGLSGMVSLGQLGDGHVAAAIASILVHEAGLAVRSPTRRL